MNRHAGASPSVLHVCQPVVAGVANVVSRLARVQQDEGWRVAVASPSGGSLAESLGVAGIPHYRWEAAREPSPSLWRESRELKTILRQFQPEVVHLHSSKAGLVGRLVLRRRTPTVFSPHAWSFHHVAGATRNAVLGWERFGARWSDIILCGSEDERREGESAGIRGRYRVIPNSAIIENPGLSQDEARLELGLPLGVPLAVCVGRFTRQKGQDILLDAWARLAPLVPDARLALVGDGPDKEAIKARAGSQTIFGEAREQGSVARWMLSADVLVFPSRWETLSLAVLEGLQLGRPVVVSDCGGMREALAGGAGTMVPVEDPGGLVEALLPYLEDREYARSTGELAKARFEVVHGASIRKRDSEYLRILQELIAE